MEKEEKILLKIQAGEKIESPKEMTDEYRENLINLMLMQADSELAGAYGYAPMITKAPNIKETLVVATIVKDEVRHARVIYRLLEDLGIDVNSRFKQHDYTFRVEDQVDLGSQRAAKDARVNIFYYPLSTWADFIMFNFCMDRGAGHQLVDALHCSYGPWSRAMEGIFKEENMHVSHGETWVKRLAQDPSTRDEAQEALNRWYPRTMNIFGRPNTPRNKLYRKLGLKHRDNDEVRQAFVKEVQELVEQVGLTLPEWKPDWEKISEEAIIPG
jgi:ring-1,2-phenylacetyl-CoA epoxidase subunit PaaA